MTPYRLPRLAALVLVLLPLHLAFAQAPVTRSAAADRPRLLVLTDIGGDPDDQQSIVRLMLYANEFEIEGLVASAAGTPGELKERTTKPHLIREIVEAYGKVRPNLVKHAAGYPEAADLLAVVRSGNPNRGWAAVGDGQDTDGSRHLIAAADKPDPRPLNVSIWGGQTDLAQALWRVRKDRGDAGYQAFVRKLRVYDIADQDKIAGRMLTEYPVPFYVLANAPPGRDKREGVFRGMYLGGDVSLVSREWMETNVRQNHGPLGALYPPKTWTAPNPHGATKEGDTPSWFYFLPHGVNDPTRPDWGGWGGRFLRDEAAAAGRGVAGAWRDAADTVDGVTEPRATVWRWRPAFQADFRARLGWCVTDDFAKANHPPVLVIDGDASRAVVAREMRSGDVLTLDTAGTHDPDDRAGGPPAVEWTYYPEPGTYRGDPGLPEQSGRAARGAFEFRAPDVAAPQTIHLIVSAREPGPEPLTVHRRVVVTVRPK